MTARPTTEAPEDESHATGEDRRRRRIEIMPTPLTPSVPSVEGMVGESARMRQLAADILRVSRFGFGVLITGKNGTGKTAAARAIHRASPRSERPFLDVNCAALPRDLIEKILFGHERGAFTGAGERQPGLFEAAEGGTLFLDEIGDFPFELQAKLLKAIEQKNFMRVGGSASVSCDVRVIAATKTDLEAMVKAGTFREDLYYRLKVLSVHVPSLDERREDIPALAQNALEVNAAELGRGGGITIGDDAMRLLIERAWPGNVRQLQNAVIEIASHLEEGRDEITAADVERVLGQNLLEFGERDGDAMSIIVPPYIIGEDIDHFLDRTLLGIYNTLLGQTGSVQRVAQLLGQSGYRALGARLNRAEVRLRAAAVNASVVVGRLRLRARGKG